MKAKDKNNVMQVANFIEELAWLLNSKKKIDLENAAQLLRTQIESSQSPISNEKYNNNRNHLVGILPFLFQDKEIFKVNKDIVDFAENLFEIKITRADRRSQYELIGLVVTEITKVDEDKLFSIMQALSYLTDNDDKLKKFRKQRQDIDFSWNDAISKLSEF